MARRVLVITRNLPPLIGGMERLVWHMVDALTRSFNVRVIGPRGCKQHLPEKAVGMEVPVRPLPLFLLSAQIAALRETLRFRPQAILAGSGLTAPMAWISGRLQGSCCLVYLHGSDIATNHPLYRTFWRPFIIHSDRIITNSSYTKQLSFQAGAQKDKITILHPGVTLPDYSKRAQIRRVFRDKYKLVDRPLLLYVGRITAQKGLSYFIERIFPRIVGKRPDTHLVVIGDDPSSAILKQKGEKEKVIRILEDRKLINHAIFLDRCSLNDPLLSAAYFSADVLIFPVRGSEGFGLVALEAAAHGLPTVAFATGGIPDVVKPGHSGYLIKPGDDHAFGRAIIRLLSSQDDDLLKDRCRRFARGFEWNLFSKRIYNCIIEKG